MLVQLFADPQSCTEYLDNSLFYYNKVFIKKIQYGFRGIKVKLHQAITITVQLCVNVFSVGIFNIRSSQLLNIVGLPLPS